MDTFVSMYMVIFYLSFVFLEEAWRVKEDGLSGISWRSGCYGLRGVYVRVVLLLQVALKSGKYIT